MSEPRLHLKSKLSRLAATAGLLAALSPLSSAQDLQRLQNLLASMPAGSWAQASTGNLSSAFPTGSVAVDYAPYTNPGLIVTAWSSYAWDSARGDLLLFGGGHANYAGNEMYAWQASTGAWVRQSLPSQIDSQGYIPDNSAPQSSHTYDNNQYLAVNNRFIDFGGAAFPTGGQNTALVNGQIVATGPWLWNPTLADPNKVGGTTGSGYDPISLGGNMWANRANQVTGTSPLNFINSTAAARVEAGKDVVYITADPYQSGWPQLYRYTVGNLTLGQSDKWELVGLNSFSAPGFKGAGGIDSTNNLFVRSASYTGYDFDLMVWDLNGASASNLKVNTAVRLVYADGTPFTLTADYGLDYDAADGRFYAWDGKEFGVVYSFAAAKDSNGQLLSQWTVSRQTAATAAAPQGNFATGVTGKWQYIPQLNAFLALDEYRADGDAEVWLYKTALATAVPEPSRLLLTFCGIGIVGLTIRRKSRRPSAI